MLNDNATELFTVDEACELLRIGKTSFYRLLHSGKLHAFRINRKWMIPRQAIQNFILEQSHLK